MTDDVSSQPNGQDERPSSPASSSGSDSSSHPANSETSHDWVTHQMKLRRNEYTEPLNVKIKIVSWNVAGRRVSEDLTQLLVEDIEPGIYAIGLQEMDVGKSTYVVYDPSYEAEWTSAISTVLGDHYERVASHQLIGIFLIVFANKALIPAITSVQQSHLPTGVFSLLGNKGGTAIRMQCYDTTICFVNVHLYHVAEAAQRRTGDAHRILKELVFDDADSIKAHDHIFFFGDLNYRVNTTTDEAREMLDRGAMDKLLLKDQLLHLLERHKAFRGFKEAPITFPPTYKYDIGTDVFDTSDKRRCPSWTDRILWKSELPVTPLKYVSYPFHVMSDHKPISAYFDVTLQVIIPPKFQEIHATVLRELDRLENDSRPNVTISTDLLDFGNISFLEPTTRSLNISNAGTGLASFKFQDMQSRTPPNPQDYIFIRPMSGSLGPGESLTIDFTILVNNATIPYVSSGGPVDDILVLEIRNGRHMFISLSGYFLPSCFGVPLEVLSSYGGKGVRNISPSTTKRESTGGGMPTELWRMTEYILTHGETCETIFLERGDERLCREIRECLDTAKDFDDKLLDGELGVLSMAETLLRFLDALPKAVIPGEVYAQVMRISETAKSAMELVDVLPGPHANVLIFLMSFLRQMFEWKILLQNPEAKRRIVRAFAKVLIRGPKNSRQDDIRKKELLLERLLQE